MHLFLDGLFEKSTYLSFQFNGNIETASIVSFSFESKYNTTQFNYMDFTGIHQQQIPIIKFDVKTTEITGIISFESRYYLCKDKTAFQFIGQYNINKYKDYDFIGKTSVVQKESFKLISKYKLCTFNYLKFRGRYYANKFVVFNYRNKYVAYKKKNFNEKNLSFQGIHLNSRAKIKTVEGLSFEMLFLSSSMKNFNNNLFKMSSFNVSNKKEFTNEIFDCGYFNCQMYTKQAGMDSLLFSFKILKTQFVGGINHLNLGHFKAKHIPIGNLLNGLHRFVLRREIKNYHYREKSFLNKKINFINVPIKNPVFGIDTPIVELVKPFPIKDIFYLPKKSNRVFYVGNLKSHNLFLFLKKYLYHHLTDLSVTVEPIIGDEKKTLILNLKRIDIFALNNKTQKSYNLSDFSTPDFEINFLRFCLDNMLYEVSVDKELVNLQIKREDIFNAPYTVKKNLSVNNMFLITKDIALFNVTNGTSFGFCPHRKMYVSSKYKVYNSFITVSRKANKKINSDIYVAGNFTCYNNIGSLISKEIKFAISSQKQSILTFKQKIVHFDLKSRILISSSYYPGSFSYVDFYANTITETKWEANISVCKILIANNVFVLNDLKVANGI